MTRVVTSQNNKVYVTSGGKAIVSTKNITSLSVTPSTSAQTITASGTNGYNPISVDAVTASIDSNIQAQNIKFGTTILNVTGTYGGRYKLHDRVKSDSNAEIGMVTGFFLDANNVEYAVVCLDAQYRLASGVYCSDKSAVVTNLTAYTNLTLWSATETATFNTQKILDYATSKSATSTACTHCRNKYFTVNGTRYYGQLPNIPELMDIYRSRIFVNDGDPSASSYSSLIIPTNKRTWSSTQYSIANAWTANANGAVGADAKTTQYFVVPVLEIPNT